MKLLDNSSVTLFILEIPQYDFLKELYRDMSIISIGVY